MDIIWEVLTNYYRYALLGILYLFFAYVAVMALKRRFDNTIWEKPLAIVIGIPAVLFDWGMNWFITPLFWDRPATWHELVTGRLKRYKRDYSSGFKYRLASSVCRILDRFDPDGDHC